MSDRRRLLLSWKKKLLFALVPLVALLAVLEIGARLLGFEPFPEIPYRDSSLEMEWELRPATETTWGYEETLVRTNEMGFRDEEIPLEPPPGETRILFLGDSVVFGHELEEPDSIPAQLEDFLEMRTAASSIQVINAGLEGYNQYSHYYNLLHKGLQLEPDLILASFVVNDVYEPYTNMKHYGAETQLLYGQKSFGRDIKSLLRKSAFFSALERAYLGRVVLPSLDHGPYRYEVMFGEGDYPPEIEEAWREALHQMHRTRELAAERGIPFLVVSFPSRARVRGDEGALRPARRLYEYTVEMQIPLFDFYPQIMKEGDSLRLYRDEVHLTAEGNALAAEWIGRLLEETDLEQKTPGEDFEALAPRREQLEKVLYSEEP